jgi:hypothetical protein
MDRLIIVLCLIIAGAAGVWIAQTRLQYCHSYCETSLRTKLLSMTNQGVCTCEVPKWPTPRVNQ